MDHVFPRMGSDKKAGHLTFLSLINGVSDFKNHRFAESVFDSVLTDIHLAEKTTSNHSKMRATNVNVYRRVVNQIDDNVKLGIFGKVTAEKLARDVISGVNQKRHQITMPFYMNYVSRFALFLPYSVADTVLDLMNTAF